MILPYIKQLGKITFEKSEWIAFNKDTQLGH